MRAGRDGLYDWNLVTNEIYYSPIWKRMLGYEDHELPNELSVWESLVDKDDLKKSWVLIEKLKKKTDRQTCSRISDETSGRALGKYSFPR